MESPTNYTALFAPPAFYISGIVIVFLLNKFIGKKKSQA